MHIFFKCSTLLQIVIQINNFYFICTIDCINSSFPRTTLPVFRVLPLFLLEVHFLCVLVSASVRPKQPATLPTHCKDKNSTYSCTYTAAHTHTSTYTHTLTRTVLLQKNECVCDSTCGCSLL